MSELSSKDLRKVLDLAQAAHQDGQGELSVHVLAGLAGLVSCESASYTRVARSSGRLLSTINSPVDADLSNEPGFGAVFGQHPGFAAHRLGRWSPGTSVALSDLADRGALHRMPLYLDFYRPRGTRDQLLHLVRMSNGQAAVLTLNRSRRGFSRRDQAVIDLVAPHLRQAVIQREHRGRLAAAAIPAKWQTDRIDRALPGLTELTPREQQVVQFLTAGATNREIARGLVISERTVHKHLEQIYRKLALSNRTSVIAALHRAAVPA